MLVFLFASLSFFVFFLSLHDVPMNDFLYKVTWRVKHVQLNIDSFDITRFQNLLFYFLQL